jgi:hypothetical protein
MVFEREDGKPPARPRPDLGVEGWPDGTPAFFRAFRAYALPFLKCRI